MSKKDETTEDRCPNCGYCPHCGQSARPPVIPAPYPVPVPYRPLRPYPWGEVWCGRGNATTPPQFKASITINARHGNEAIG